MNIIKAPPDDIASSCPKGPADTKKYAMDTKCSRNTLCLSPPSSTLIWTIQKLEKSENCENLRIGF
jgi:hypothetical protein